jgi:pilus assembly protein CpaC
LGKILALAVLVAVQLSIVGAAQAENVDVRPRHLDNASHVTIVRNKSKNVRLGFAFADAAVGSSDIAEIVPISDRQLYIMGRKIGTTNVLLYSQDKQLVGVVDVEVKMDTGNLGAKIREASGARNIQVSDLDGKLVLSGSIEDAQTAERAISVARSLTNQEPVNALRVTSGQQVMLKVRFVEASRSAVRSIGVRWQGILNNRVAGVIGPQAGTSKFLSGAYGPGFPNSGGFPVLDVVTNSASGASPVATIIAQLINSSRGSLDVVLSALEEKGVVRRLAEPNLVALSGESADFLAGGKFPVPVVAGAGVGSLPQVTISWQEYGVKLRFRPTVLSQDIISLKLEPEVSDADPALGVSVGGVSVPALTTRRASTTVELRNGQTFAIAGLIQAKSGRDLEQLPWLGSVPVLGALFRSSDFQANETELVALVTPYLVKPAAPGRKLKTPLDSSLAANDVDFFLGGRAEIPKSPPTYATPEGTEQPAFGGIAPIAAAAEAAPPPSDYPVQQLFKRFFGDPPTDLQQK